MNKRIIFVIVLSLMITSCKNGDQQVIIIPKNFTGYIIIIYNQMKGSIPKYNGKQRIYEIPSNGILSTRFEGNYNWRKFPEYYYERIAPENKIPSFAELEKIPSGVIVGFIGATGTVKKDLGSEQYLEFAEFYVGTKEQIKIAQEQAKKIDIAKLVE